MSGKIVRRLKPEEEEILRKREELPATRATLAEREFEELLQNEVRATSGLSQ